MKQKNKQFRIGQLANQLGVERFVIRFWEKEFNISSIRSEGGQRFYRPRDYEQFKKIKQLLYDQGYTISGAKKIIQNQESENKNRMSQQILTLQKKLLRLRELL